MKVCVGDSDVFSGLGGEGGRAEGLLVLVLVLMEEEEGVVAEEQDVTGALSAGHLKLGAEPSVLLAVFVLSLEVRGVTSKNQPF